MLHRLCVPTAFHYNHHGWKPPNRFTFSLYSHCCLLATQGLQRFLRSSSLAYQPGIIFETWG
uniref:Uncharacterized protein n=1 Tax=Rhizophora mucronata TaxID=61149 RepID=A0A2P2K4T5_RHIMU